MSHTVSKEFRHQAYEAMTAEGLAVHLDTFFNAHTKLIWTLAMELRMEISCEAEVLSSYSLASQKYHSIYFYFQKRKCFLKIANFTDILKFHSDSFFINFFQYYNFMAHICKLILII